MEGNQERAAHSYHELICRAAEAECRAHMSSAFLFASIVAVVAELCLPHYFYNIAQYENSINSPYFGGCASHFNRAISCQVPGKAPQSRPLPAPLLRGASLTAVQQLSGRAAVNWEWGRGGG